MFGNCRPKLGFVVESLKRDQLRAVYPLLQHAGLTIDLRTWLRYARPLAEPTSARKRGAITVRRVEAKLPCGLFCYAREPDLVHGNIIKAEHFVVLDIVNPSDALAALLKGLDYLSSKLGILTVRAIVAPGEEALSVVMHEAGLSTDAQIFSKIIAPNSLVAGHARRRALKLGRHD